MIIDRCRRCLRKHHLRVVGVKLEKAVIFFYHDERIALFKHHFSRITYDELSAAFADTYSK